jgi:hypothetical protein
VAAVAAGLLVVVAGAEPALAKGADQVTITGPGLAAPIVLGGDNGEGEPGSSGDLGVFSDGCGLFAAMFGTDGGQQLLPQAPAGPLGPKYQLVYRVPGDDPPLLLHQDLYPDAAGGPVTYTAPGQHSFAGSTAQSGWYPAPAGFRQVLARVGIPVASASPSRAVSSTPAAAQPARDTSGGATPWWALGVAVLATLLVGGAAVLAVRRRRAATG